MDSGIGWPSLTTLKSSACSAEVATKVQLLASFSDLYGGLLLQISSNFAIALARSLSANQGREIAQNRNIDPRDSVVKDLTASRWSKHRDGSWRSRLYGAWPGGMRYIPANVFGRIEKHAPVSGTFCWTIYNHEENQLAIGGSTVERKWLGRQLTLRKPVQARWEPTYPTQPGRRQACSRQASPNYESRASIAPVAVKSFTTLSRG